MFAVDLFNEGVDVPEIDTVLFPAANRERHGVPAAARARPSTVEGKDCLTVLDFIGQASKQFRFDQRYRALTGTSRAAVKRQIEQGFPLLPAGCSIQLDRVASDIVLENVSSAIGSTFKSLVAELRSLNRDVTLSEFLREADVIWRTCTGTQAGVGPDFGERSGCHVPSEGPDEPTLARGLRRLVDLEDPEWIELLGRVASSSKPPRWLRSRSASAVS